MGMMLKEFQLLKIVLDAQVWVKPQVRDGKIYWLADSDSALTKVHGSLLYNLAPAL